jgi:Eukaryotic aspartyl protease
MRPPSLRRSSYSPPSFDAGSVLTCGILLSLWQLAASEPAPIVATTSTDFLGYDGLWSAISIRAGSPEQYLSLLPSTLGQETWVIGPSGCDGTTVCENKRGGLFSANESSSFRSRGDYELNFDPQLGNGGVGYYGLDTVSLDDADSVGGQIIAVVNSTDYWIGSLGLGVQQSRFSDSEDLSPLLSSLIEKGNEIPSRSYGYTAGAFYRMCSSRLYQCTPSDIIHRSEERPCIVDIGRS